MVRNVSKFDERFTREEAEGKLGKRVRNPCDFSGIPKWTRGTVVEIDEVGNGYDVVIQWDIQTKPPVIAQAEIDGELFALVRAGHPSRDWFTKYEYENFLLEEVQEPIS